MHPNLEPWVPSSLCSAMQTLASHAACLLDRATHKAMKNGGIHNCPPSAKDPQASRFIASAVTFCISSCALRRRPGALRDNAFPRHTSGSLRDSHAHPFLSDVGQFSKAMPAMQAAATTPPRWSHELRIDLFHVFRCRDLGALPSLPFIDFLGW